MCFIVLSSHIGLLLFLIASRIQNILRILTTYSGNSKFKLLVFNLARVLIASLIRLSQRLSLMTVILRFFDIVIIVSKSL
jgi:hypothetical protein